MSRLMIADRISQYRRKKGVSLRELGDILGVSAQAVSKWEKGYCCPDITLLPELAEVLEIELQDFFDLSETTE